MDRKLSFILLLPMMLAVSACGQGSVEVKFTSAEATDFDGGRAGTCNLKGIVENKTKYHLKGLSFKIGDYSGEFGEMNAQSSSIDPENLISVSLDGPDATCAAVARSLNENVSEASVFDCKMTDVAEGDCQDMVHISSTISGDDITRLANFEQHQLEYALSPLHKAMAALTNSHDDNQILDALVQLDAQSWAVNRYDVGSMNGATVVSQSSDGSERTVRANYTYNQGLQGWVKATLYKDTNILPCMEFHDFAGSCRPLRLPDPSSYTVPVPMQPAPPPTPDDDASGTQQNNYSREDGSVAQPAPPTPTPDEAAPVNQQNDYSQEGGSVPQMVPPAQPAPPPTPKDEIKAGLLNSPDR